MVPAVSEAQAAGKGVKASARLPVRADESPWTRRELDGVRAELVADLARLGDEVATLQNSIDDVLRDTGDGVGDDQADSGAKAFEREQEMALLATARERQFQTERALHRISDGSYGSCGSCGVPIGKLRLQAFPRASLCVSCKQQEERR
jgi:RNA polymerase-binding transcription factor DksA